MEQQINLDDLADSRIESTLLDNSVHFLYGEIDESSIAAAIKWILYENFTGGKKQRTLTMYISSEGGDLYQAFALIDIMKSSRHKIQTVAVGSCMSAAFLIFIAGTKGERLVGPNASLMCHQYSGTSDAKHHDLRAMMAEGDNCHARMDNLIIACCPGNSKDLLRETDVYLTAQQAIDMGVADGYI